MPRHSGIRPRILYIVTNGHIGGPQTHLMYCTKHFGNAFDIELCVGTEGHLADEIRKASIPVHVFPVLGGNRPSLDDPMAVGSLVNLVRRFQPNLISCHSTKAGFLGRIVGRITKTPVIFTAHGWAFRGPLSRRLIAPPIERALARWSRRIICVSEYDRELAIRHRVGVQGQLVVVHNGAPISPQAPSAIPNASGKVILTMTARFAEPKAHGLLLKALSRLDKRENFEVRFIGSGELEDQVRQEAVRLNLADRVRFLGDRSNEQLPRLLAQSHVFLLISNWEGFPRSILEAMRAGLPVVASDVGGVREAVLDGKTGFLVPPGDVEALTQKLQVIIRQPDLRSKMGGEGYQYFLKHFTLDKMLDKTGKIYSEVMRETESQHNPEDRKIFGANQPVPDSHSDNAQLRHERSESPKGPGTHPARFAHQFLKRAFDFSLAGVGIAASLPLWLLIASAIRLEDGGPVFFNQPRVGKNGNTFLLLKFRTMNPDAEKELGPIQALKNDPRVTRIGKILRKTALDELPQLWNIFIGEMSFVGPRPLRPDEILVNGNEPVRLQDLPGYEERHRVRPGLTGLTQVYAPRDLPHDKKILYDLRYVRRQNFLLDLKLIALSFLRTFSGRWEI